MYMYTTAARDVNIYRGALRGIAFNSLLRGLRLASHPPHETGVVFEWGWIAHASRESTGTATIYCAHEIRAWDTRTS